MAHRSPSKFEEDHYISDALNKLNDNSRINTSRQGKNALSARNMNEENSKAALRVKADYKPEIFFIGQIVGGSDFPTEIDGLFVEASLKFGENWKMFDKVPTLQTQT